jgi:hypothetical protein
MVSESGTACRIAAAMFRVISARIGLLSHPADFLSKYSVLMI